MDAPAKKQRCDPSPSEYTFDSPSYDWTELDWVRERVFPIPESQWKYNTPPSKTKSLSTPKYDANGALLSDSKEKKQPLTDKIIETLRQQEAELES